MLARVLRLLNRCGRARRRWVSGSRSRLDALGLCGLPLVPGFAPRACALEPDGSVRTPKLRPALSPQIAELLEENADRDRYGQEQFWPDFHVFLRLRPPQEGRFSAGASRRRRSPRRALLLGWRSLPSVRRRRWDLLMVAFAGAVELPDRLQEIA